MTVDAQLQTLAGELKSSLMDIIFAALADTLVPWIEDRYGKVAAVLIAVLLVILPVIALIGTVIWLTGGL
jgi:glycerol-3-phosphate acyltransferase PlsY